ncbi:hypothetical protein GT347_09225 [Xylophilus rhododendri]|uniref:PilY1 beta-propeller domain-containing protein n=1 Tax=Xylophilus rhododendri TaxID=2697032 RepID=A0A857J4L1_9BURK|nr:PilC/PilY family type IV pilus protein [Xylophilus rhododendri]QHI98153.1 hypothetical protein GT347_09225 [Xylophilus rhododendri]
MNLHSFLIRSVRAAAGWLLAAGLLAGAAQAAVTDLANAPLETSTATLVKPNIFFVLDDSGSMDYNYLPDWVPLYPSLTGLFLNSRFNGQAYDPAVTYTPPLKYDGSSYPSMTSANTTSWLRVPMDGFGVQSTLTGILTTGVSYYTFIAGEYCNSPNLRTCVTQSAPSTAYPYPAYLRWCSSVLLTNCQATRIETAPAGGSTYLNPRYPGALLGTVPGSQVLTTINILQNSYVYPGTSAKASSRTDCAGTTCTYAEEITNYANWYAYYQTRMQATKTAISQSFNVLGTSYRLGFMTINNNNGNDFLNISDITTGSSGQKAAWYAKLFRALPSNSTPLRRSLSTAGRYYAGKLTSINSQSAVDPIQYACQRNYTMLATDGYWNESANPVQIDGATAIGDQDGGETRPYLDGNATPNTLADVAEYFYATDLRSSTLGNVTNASGVDVSSNSYSNKQQRMNTYTIGLGASGYMQYLSGYATASSGDYYNVANVTATSSSTLASGVCSWQSSGNCNWPVPVNNSQTTIDDLWHAAVNGRGTYYSATNSSDLKAGLSNFLNAVVATAASSASPTLYTPNLVSGSGNYVFSTVFCSAKWFGDLIRYSIDGTTGQPSSSASWAESGAGGDCVDATGALTTTPLLDRLGFASRTIYTYDPATSTALLPFQWSSLSSTVKGYFQMAAIGGLSQICSSASNCLIPTAQVDSSTAGTTTGAGGINLVNYLRGDRSNEGSSNTSYYFPRTHVLGDIVNSQPVYVQAPSYNYSDSGYTAFKSAQSARQGMVYVGANDGMLHAFNSDNGAEAWAYIPSMLLPSLYKLADKNYAATHQPFVDGPLVQADIYASSAWRTILVGGLGSGGRGYYALDVTTPSSPTLLWEFTADTTKSSPYIVDQDLGYTYGQPVVTKLGDGTWVVLVTSGYNNVSPGSGHGILWVLNARTGAVIKKIDTGVGTTATGGTVTGCSTAPCPSGLAKIGVWTDTEQNATGTQVYGGDLYGNLWRFDISALTASGGTATVQLLATLADASGNRQPITSTPELGLASNVRMVYQGTGAYLGVSDISTTQSQTMYAIKDTLATATGSLYGSPRANTCAAAATSSGCFVRQILTDASGTRTSSSSVSYSWSLATMNGWYIDMPTTGERMDVDPILQLSTLFFVSNAPSTAGACSVGGSSYKNYVNYSTGLAVAGATNSGTLLSSTSLASGVVLARTTTGSVIAVIKSSDGSVATTPVPVAGSSTGTRRISWRRLTDSQ